MVQYICTAPDGTVVYEWHSDIYSDVEVRAGRNNGEASIIPYSDILEQWRNRLFGAGNTVITDIAAAAEAEKTSIELKGQETLATIPADYTTTYNMAEEALRRKADAIELEVEGVGITVDNASDGYLLGLEVYGKTEQNTTSGVQLLNISEDNSTLDRGLTQIVEKGVCSVSGTASSTGGFSLTLLGTYTNTKALFTLEAGTYTATDCSLYSFDGTTRKDYRGTFTLEEPTDITWVATRSFANGETVKETTYPMLVYGTVERPWEPYSYGRPSPSMKCAQEMVSIENPLVGIFGINLADIQNIDVHANQTLEISEDSYTIVASGGSDKPYTSSTVSLNVDLLKGKRVILKADSITNTNTNAHGVVQLNVKTPSGRMYMPISTYALSKTIDIPSDTTELILSVYTNNTESALAEDNTNTVKGLGVYFVDSDWKPYVPIQTAKFPYVLRGNKIDSGGNYIDSTGQRWVADYVDCENKRIVRRIGLMTLDSTRTYHINAYRLQEGLYVFGTNFKTTDDYESPLYADKLQYQLWGYLAAGEGRGDKIYKVSDGIFVYLEDQSICTVADFTNYVGENPIVVQYILGTPVYEPLTDEEVAAYKALHSNYYTTTIQNDSKAHMKVTYAADTEIFLRDNQPVPTEEQVSENIRTYLDEKGAQYPSDEHINELIHAALEECLNGVY